MTNEVKMYWAIVVLVIMGVLGLHFSAEKAREIVKAKCLELNEISSLQTRRDNATLVAVEQRLSARIINVKASCASQARKHWEL